MTAPTRHQRFATELDIKLEDYWQVLQSSNLAEKSMEDYYYFAFCFVRWINGSFVPGGTIK